MDGDRLRKECGKRHRREANEEGMIKAEMGKQFGRDPTNNHKWSGILEERETWIALTRKTDIHNMDSILQYRKEKMTFYPRQTFQSNMFLYFSEMLSHDGITAQRMAPLHRRSSASQSY